MDPAAPFPDRTLDGDILESLVSNFRRFLKIDEQIASLSWAKYARVCIELDILTQPLWRGFWTGDEEHRVFVVIQYERLLTFCYHCGLIGYGKSSCPNRSTFVSKHSSVVKNSECVSMEMADQEDQMEPLILHQV